MNLNFNRMSFVFVLLFFVSLLLSCTQENRTPALRVGANQWMGYEPLFLARDLGEYNPKFIKLAELKSTSDVLRMLRRGMLDVAAITLDEALSEISLGTKLSVILLMDSSAGADMVLARPGFANMLALKGKKIGVENNAVGALTLRGALNEAGLKTTDIHIVPLTIDQHFTALKHGDIDAVVTFSPVSNKLIEEEGAIKVFDSAQIPNQILDVLVVRTEVLVQQQDNIQRLIDGHATALAFLKEFPKQVTDIMNSRLGLTGGKMLVSYEGIHIITHVESRELFTKDLSKMQRMTDNIQSVLLEADILDKRIETAKLFDSRFLINSRVNKSAE